MILYFSGTGNSKFVAEVLGDQLNDEVVSLRSYLKSGRPAEFHSEKPYVIAAPIYAWRFPKNVVDFVKASEFKGNKKVYFVCSMGEDLGNAPAYCEDLCKKKDLEYCGLKGIVMPVNYPENGKLPSKTETYLTATKAKSELKEVAQQIAAGEKLDEMKANASDYLKSAVINPVYPHWVGSQQFSLIEDKCTGCGTCVELCIINNISLKEGKASFGKNCIGCYACYQYCPEKAIILKKYPDLETRYHGPGYKNGKVTVDENEIF